MSTTRATADATSIWRGALGPVTVGLFSLAFMVAFEALAVATLMPVVADDLDGLPLYAVAFAAPVAVSILSRTAAAPLIDRDGPAPALVWGTVSFSVGLVGCGLAPSMPLFLLGRAVQGVGMGAIGVALYVVVAQSYPARLRPRALAVMTSAWTFPALVGPGIAGWIDHVVGWRWVFLGAPALAVVSLAITWHGVRGLRGSGERAGAVRPVVLSGVVAVGVLALAIVGQRPPGWVLLLVGSLVVVAWAARPLLPAGTLTGRSGMPALLGARALLAAAYFGAEAYVPLALVRERGLDPAQAGLLLTAAACSWFGGSWLVAHPERVGRPFATAPRRAAIGATAITTGCATGLAVLVPQIPMPVVAVGWAIGGFGMGAAMSVIVARVLELSAPGTEGANSAALQTGESIAESLMVALGAVAFAILLPLGLVPALLVVLGASLLVALAGLGLVGRGWQDRSGLR